MKMNSKVKNFALAGGLLVLLFCLRGFSFGTPAKIKGFSLRSCAVKNCLMIDSPEAAVGSFFGSYAFKSAKITIVSKKTKETQVLSANDVFYDFFSGRIYIRQMEEHKNSEGLYDLEKETLSIYKTGHPS